MGRLLEIVICLECRYHKLITKYIGEYWHGCLKSHNKKIENIYIIPEWCPLPEAKGPDAMKKKEMPDVIK